MPPDAAVLDAPAPAGVETLPQTRRIVAAEVHGDRAAVRLDCGHVADLPADRQITARCPACPRLDVPSIKTEVAAHA